MSASSAPQPANPLSALADVATNLWITLPDSPQGKLLVDHDDAISPSTLLRATRRRLNLTQREFGALLSQKGCNPISPSVVCQLESSVQPVSPQLITRLLAVTAAVHRFGEYLAARMHAADGTLVVKGADADAALKALGPGCIDEFKPYLDSSPALDGDAAVHVCQFLSIVTKRRHSNGGSRPGARGPYRKHAKPPTSKAPHTPKLPTPSTLSTLSTLSTPSSPMPKRSASGGESAPSLSAPSAPALVATSSPIGLRPKPSAAPPRVPSGPSGSGTPSVRTSPSSTLAPTPASSCDSSRARSPPGAHGAEGTLRRLQQENEALQRENKRLRSMAHGAASEVDGRDVVEIASRLRASTSA